MFFFKEAKIRVHTHTHTLKAIKMVSEVQANSSAKIRKKQQTIKNMLRIQGLGFMLGLLFSKRQMRKSLSQAGLANASPQEGSV